MKEINKFYKSLIQEVATRQIANEEGDNQEQTFTRMCLELLSEAGETENSDVAFYERDLGTKKQQKINGYAIADNYETVDLFISIYEGTDYTRFPSSLMLLLLSTLKRRGGRFLVCMHHQATLIMRHTFLYFLGNVYRACMRDTEDDF